MRPEPRSAINELSSERRELWSEIAATHVVDELRIRRLIKKLDSLVVPSHLLDSTVAIALHEQSYLYAYQLKIDAALRLLADAERAGLPSVAAAVSRAHILYICGDLEMSRRVLLDAELDDADSSGLAGIADGCAHSGLFIMAADLYMRAGKNSGEVSQHLLVAAEIMTDIGATDEQVSKRLVTASKIIRSMTSHPHIALDIFAMHGEGILYRFMVKDRIERLLEIDCAIDIALSSSYEEAIDQVLSIGVAPHEDGVVLAAEDGFYVRM